MKAAKVTIHFCKSPHPATILANKTPIGRLLYEAAETVGAANAATTHAVVAYQNRRIVGVLKYFLFDDTLVPSGTIVDPRCRRRGIARKLWKAVIKKHSPKIIDVSVSSVAGMKLVKQLKTSYPSIVFVVHDYVS